MPEPMAHWPMHTRVYALAAQMDEVMEALRLDLLDAARKESGAGLARARDTCLRCGASRLCRTWLEASIALEEPPVFCPNAPFFSSCRKRELARSAAFCQLEPAEHARPVLASASRSAVASSAPE